MSRFDEEWAIVPAGARWAAALVSLAFVALMAAFFLLPALAAHDHRAMFALVPIFLLTLFGVVPLAIYVLLLGYVWGDARRRGMNHLLWTLLALLIPYVVGVILYFIVREPLPVPCPACGAPARKGHAFCASCGAAVRAACPHCRQPVEPGWRNCASCGQPLSAQESSSRSASGPI
jgi:hypothetical protein